MPEDIHDTINRAANKVRNLYLIHVGILSYIMLTLFTTTDLTLVMDGAVDLFLLPVDVPLWWFVFTASGAAFLSYGFLKHFLVQLHSSMLSVHIESRKVSAAKLPSWLMKIGSNRRARLLVSLTLWFYLPSVMLLLNVWVIQLQFVDLTSQLNAFPLISMVMVIWFWFSPYPSKSPLDWMQFSLKPNLKPGASTGTWYFIFLTGFLVLEIGLLSIMNISDQIGEPFVIDLRHQDMVAAVSEKAPAEDKSTDSFKFGYFLQGARLDGTNFKGFRLNGRFSRASLVSANLQSTEFLLAKFHHANLSHADLHSSSLKSAFFHNTDLRGANFQFAICSYAEFVHAWLDGAVFDNADLTSAKFIGIGAQRVGFKNAIMVSSQLSDAIFLDSDFKNANLAEAKIYRSQTNSADFTDANLHNIDLAYSNAVTANFSNANLLQATLHRSNLQGANFDGANLERASFSGSNLSKAKLSNAINLTAEQLQDVKTLREAELPLEIEASLRDSHPHLF